jgi:hypothetical protein
MGLSGRRLSFFISQGWPAASPWQNDGQLRYDAAIHKGEEHGWGKTIRPHNFEKEALEGFLRRL